MQFTPRNYKGDVSAYAISFRYGDAKFGGFPLADRSDVIAKRGLAECSMPIIY